MQPNKITDQVDFHVDNDKLPRHVRSLIERHSSLLKTFFLHQFAFCLGVLVIPLYLFLLFVASLVGFLSVYGGALALSFSVLTTCLCFIGNRYLVLSQSERLSLKINAFASDCRALLPHWSEIQESHHLLANAHTLFAEELKGKEVTYLQWNFLPRIFLGPFGKVSVWLFGTDLQTMRELLLKRALDEQLLLIRNDPLNLTYHSQLATSYVLLSRLFLTPSKLDQTLFRRYATCAVAEFQIIASYAPDDLWVHLQLSRSYRDLDLPQDEMRACEAVLNLSPSDTSTLLRLGTLYFQQGNNGKGLTTYEELRKYDWQLAEQLIARYGVSSEQVVVA